MRLHFNRVSGRKHRSIRLERLEDRTAPAAWVAQGPSPTLGGQTENLAGPNPVSGAVHAVQAHPTDANILYVGATNGGIWKTTNATAASPTWVPLTDTQSSQSIGALEFDPTDATNNTLVVGHGRYSSFASEGATRAGLLKTTDGGSTWTSITGGGAMVGRNISGVIARGNTIVVSVNFADPSFDFPNIGIFRSTNGGASFTQMSSGNGAATGLPGGVSFDLVGDPTNNAVLYTSIKFASFVGGTNGVFKSVDTGLTWTRVSDATMDALIQDSTTSNLEITVGNANNVYVGIVNNGQIAGIFRSGNGGSSWTAMDLPRTLDGGQIALTNATNASPIVITSNNHGLTTGNQVRITGVVGNTAANGDWSITVVNTNTFQLNNSTGNGGYTGGGTWQKISGLQPREKPLDPGGQGSVHFSIAADPTNANIVYVGGDRQDFPFPNSLGAFDFSGRLFRGDASILASPGSVPSPQWTSLTHSGTSNNSAPHADSRDMDFDANGNLIEVDDGGVFRRSSPRLTTGSWASVNGTLQVAELHNIAYDNRTNTLISGAQDTGTPQQTTADGVTWTAVSNGDGGDVAVDEVTLAGSNQSIRYSSFQNLGNLRRQVYNASNNFVSQTNITLPGTFFPNFVTPVELNAVTPTRLVVAGTGASPSFLNGMFESLNQGSSWTQITGPGFTTFPQNAIVYGHSGNADVIWAGSAGNVYRRTSSGGNLVLTSAAFPGGGTVWDIALGTTSDTAFVIDDNQVYSTTNGGTSWTDVTGNLISGGAIGLRSIEYIPTATGDFLVVGTRTGVYKALVSSPTVWSLFGTGLPIVPVFDMEYDATDDVLVLGTFGRGAWKMIGVSLSETDVIVNASQAGGNGQNNGTADNFRLAVSGTNLEIYIQGTLSRTVLLSGINSITVEGSGDADSLDMSGGLINVPGGVSFTGGSGTDSLRGPDATTSWSIAAAGIGTLTSGAISLSFTSLENATGGTGSDAFNFGASGILNGTIDGGSGTDSLSGTNAGHNFAINASNAGTVNTILANGFVGIENLVGGFGSDVFQFNAPGILSGTIQAGAGNDTVAGDNASRIFAITGANAGTVGGLLAAGFTNVENVQGGSAADAFTFGVGSSLSGNVVGGAGIDTLTGDSVGRTYSLTGLDAGTVSGLSVFSEIENLTAGNGADTLVRLPAGTLSGSFDGRGGLDTANLSAMPTAQTVLLTGSNHEGFTATLAGIGVATGLDRIIATSKTTDAISGLAMASAWQVKAGTNQTYYRRTGTGDTLYLAGFEQMLGNASTDAFNIDFSAGVPLTTAGLTLNGAGGSDTINIVGTVGADSFSIVVGTLAVNGRTIRHSGVESIAVRGGNGADTFVAGIGLPVGLALLELFGDAGNDFAKVVPSTNTKIVFNGGSGTDRLRVDKAQSGLPLLTPPAGVLSGTYLFAIHRPIEFLSVEKREFGKVP